MNTRCGPRLSNSLQGSGKDESKAKKTVHWKRGVWSSVMPEVTG